MPDSHEHPTFYRVMGVATLAYIAFESCPPAAFMSLSFYIGGELAGYSSGENDCEISRIPDSPLEIDADSCEDSN